MGWDIQARSNLDHDFCGIMTAITYGQILQQSLVPFIRSAYTDGHRLYQDNDPKHTSRYIQRFFEENGINWWKSPAESLDINCIENVWAALKYFLRDKYKPKTIGELMTGIRVFWKKMTPELCTKYENHVVKLLPAVVEAEGGPSGH